MKHKPATAWEKEIDQLMNEQMVTLDFRKRKKLYDRVQQIISEQLPFVFLSRDAHILAGAKAERRQFSASFAGALHALERRSDLSS